MICGLNVLLASLATGTAFAQGLAAAGAGILTITDQRMEQFNTLLLDYYNTGDGEALKLFLYSNCIQGIEI